MLQVCFWRNDLEKSATQNSDSELCCLAFIDRVRVRKLSVPQGRGSELRPSTAGPSEEELLADSGSVNKPVV